MRRQGARVLSRCSERSAPSRCSPERGRVPLARVRAARALLHALVESAPRARRRSGRARPHGRPAPLPAGGRLGVSSTPRHEHVPPGRAPAPRLRRGKPRRARSSGRLRRHVATCSACQETLRELSHAVDVLERLPTVGIPHDGMRPAAPARNRRRLWTRALPIFAIVLAAGAVVQELRPSATGVERRRSTARAAAAKRPAFTSTSDRRARAGDPAPTAAASRPRSQGFAPYIPPDHGSLVALVDFDDLPAAAARAATAKGAQRSRVLLIGVQGLHGGARPREHAGHRDLRARAATSGRSRARAGARRPGSSSARSPRAAPSGAPRSS